MSDESGKSFFATIPLPGLIAVITGMLGAVLTQYEPLMARRPMESTAQAAVSSSSYEIEATLYEDPLAVCARMTFRMPHPESAKPTGDIKASRLLHQPSTLLREVCLKTSGGKKLLVIPVFLKSGSELVNVEARARTRLAVIEGLASCGYIPTAHGKLECCRFPEWRDISGELHLQGGLDVPIEWFNSASMPSLATPTKCEAPNALVMWLRGEATAEMPMAKLRWLLQNTLCGSTPCTTIDRSDAVWVRAIGPPSTDALASLVKEGADWRMPPDVWPRPISLYSQAATASSKAVLEAASVPIPENTPPDQVLRDKIHESLRSKNFWRTITTDDQVAAALVDELKLRGVDLQKVALPDRPPHIAIISEFDTSYGRSLPAAFLHAADPDAKIDRFNDGNSSWHWFNFPRGLDGRSAGSISGAAPASTSKAGSKIDAEGNSYKPDEIPAGSNQADALRRLADQLAELDAKLVRRKNSESGCGDARGGGIRAIGLMGGDVYDKLWILRALKPRFPNVIFFTDNLDAWLWQRDEMRSTRNLVIASPYGLSLSYNFQMGKAPFRDSDQTSTYAATLAVLDALPATRLEKTNLADVRRYEIGRSGPCDLSQPTIEECKSNFGEHAEEMHGTKIHPTPLEPWWNWRKVYGVAITGFCILLMVALGGAIPRMVSTKGADLPLWKKAVNTLLMVGFYYFRNPFMWAPVLVFVPFLAIYELWQGQRVIGEPFFLWEGVSGWPTQGLRIAAILLAFHLMILLFVRLEENARDLKKRFFATVSSSSDPAPVAFWFWRSAALKGKKVRPIELWEEYLQYSHWKKRCVRALAISLVLGGALWFIRDTFGTGISAMRGTDARRWDSVLDVGSSIAFIVLSALVVDAMWTGRMFIRWVTAGMTEWPGTQTEPYRKGRISEEAACDYLDLQLVAARTQPIVDLAFFPFYVLVLLAISRLDIFDHWTWRRSTIIIFAICVSLVLIAAKLLRSEAEKIRKQLIYHLHEAQPPLLQNDRSACSLLIREVGALKRGAFTPFSEQPVMKTIYWLVSGLGIGGLWQYFSQVL